MSLKELKNIFQLKNNIKNIKIGKRREVNKNISLKFTLFSFISLFFISFSSKHFLIYSFCNCRFDL